MYEFESALSSCLKFHLGHLSTYILSHYQHIISILQKHAPIKKRYAQSNQASFINIKIHKGIMRRTRLKNKFLGSKADADRIALRNNVITVFI